MSCASRPVFVAAIAVAVLAAAPAFAHVTLEGREATIGASYKAVFVVPPMVLTKVGSLRIREST